MSVVVANDGARLCGKRANRGASVLRLIDNYVSIDIETTGLDARWCDIIEVAAVRYRSKTEVERYHSLVYCEGGVDEFIESLTGITNEMLIGAPVVVDVLSELKSFIGDDVVIGHNVSFDVNFIYDKCVSLGLPVISNDFVDTMRLFRRILPNLKNYKLSTLVTVLNIPNDKAHRAESDAIATAACYEYIKDYIASHDIDISSLLMRHKSDLKASEISPAVSTFDELHPLYGKVCVFTGTLDRMLRREAMQIVADHGGVNEDKVTKRTNFLILGNNDYCSQIKDGKSNKQKKAEAYKLAGHDIEIISEDVFYDMLDN